MSEEIIQLSSGFAEKSRGFISGAALSELKSVFPGFVASPGECFFPTYIVTKGAYKRIRVTVGLDKPTSLCFSKIVFAGTIGDDDTIVNVSDLAQCTQSSQHKASSSPASAIEGAIFSNNIHSEKEVNPWWEATFPDNVWVKGVYFYRRTDWSIIHETHLRVTGVSRDGDETVLYFPENIDRARIQNAEAIETAVNALEQIGQGLQGSIRQQYHALVSSGLSDIQLWLEEYASSGKLPALKGSDRKAAALKIIQALALSIGSAKDFGIFEEDALTIDLPDVEAKQIRVRVYGETPVGLGGLEIYSNSSDQLIKSFNKKDLKFRYNFSALQSPRSFSADLYTNIQSRRVDLEKIYTLNKLRVWNLSRQHAANTLFLEVTMRTDDQQPWKVVYDHGAIYRQTLNALRLVNYLIRADWPPEYARLISKLFSMYRRKRLMGPLARLVRHREPLNTAVFEGSDEIWPKTKYAAPLRLGKHGLRVPIGYRDEETIMGHLLEMRDKIRALGHKPLFMYGTLLGAIREKDFIPHDDDVDLAVIMSGVGPDRVNEECDKFIDLLNENGVKANRGARHSPLIHCHRGPVTYDIFILGHVGDTVYWPHTALKVVPERADIFLPTGEVEFKGEMFDAPANPPAVCEARYGKDWQTPNPAFEW